MTGRYRAFAQLAVACAVLGGAAVSWLNARHTVSVAPIAEGQPSTTALVYDPQLLLLTMILLTTAGVLVVTGVARLRRAPARPTS
ncbi:MAG: hypothetical protein QOC58_744 [Mycobacterium sp.]|nr:hypothetical protein [Mycobacterium sp.]